MYFESFKPKLFGGRMTGPTNKKFEISIKYESLKIQTPLVQRLQRMEGHVYSKMTGHRGKVLHTGLDEIGVVYPTATVSA